jgi:hypothetical protein
VKFGEARVCDSCDIFAATTEITSAARLEALLTDLFHEGVQTDILEVVDGSVKWDDVVNSILRCRRCGQRFQLNCETYHGYGGRFEPVE